MPKPKDDKTIVIEMFQGVVDKVHNSSDFKIEIHDHDVESYDDDKERHKDEDGQEYVIISI